MGRDLFAEHGIDYSSPNSTEVKPSWIKNIVDALGGASVGAAQGISDIGANIAQFPGDIYSALSGKPGYKSPHPDIREYAPSSDIGKVSESVGEFASPFVSPGLAAETLFGKALMGGKFLPRMALGAFTGAAQSENRDLGALLGAAFPAAGKFIRIPKTSNAAVKGLNKAREMSELHEPLKFNMSNELMGDIENQFSQNKLLSPSQRSVDKLMTELVGGGYKPYFDLQSSLGMIGRELKGPKQMSGIKSLFFPNQTTAAERLTGKEVEGLRQRLIDEMQTHLKGSNLDRLAHLEKQGRSDYAAYKNFAKIRNKAIMGSLLASPVYHGIKYFL